METPYPTHPNIIHGPSYSSYDSWIGAWIQGSGAGPAAPSIVTGTPIILDVEIHRAGEATLTCLVGAPPSKACICLDLKSQVPLKPSEYHAQFVASSDMTTILITESSPDTIMGEDLRTIDYVVAEAKQLANLDQPSQVHGFVGRCNCNSARDVVDIFQDTQDGKANMERVIAWCRDRKFDSGIEMSTNLASAYRTHRPFEYRCFDGELQDIASTRNKPIGNQDLAPDRPWKVHSPRAVRITIYEVLTGVVGHNIIALTQITRDTWDTFIADLPILMCAQNAVDIMAGVGIEHVTQNMDGLLHLRMATFGPQEGAMFGSTIDEKPVWAALENR